MTTARESDVKVAKETSFLLIPDSIVTFDRAYVDFSLFQTYQDKGVFFVTRAKDNLRFEFLGQQDIPKKKGLQFDHIVQIKSSKQREKHPGKLRLIGYYDHEKNKTYTFLTNNFKLAAIQPFREKRPHCEGVAHPILLKDPHKHWWFTWLSPLFFYVI